MHHELNPSAAILINIRFQQNKLSEPGLSTGSVSMGAPSSRGRLLFLTGLVRITTTCILLGDIKRYQSFPAALGARGAVVVQAPGGAVHSIMGRVVP